ncbi:MAG TPA: GlxA family transcriptional regulator [Bryobacteraceae bacterium]|nr:GlxA family transcriptional regulator [Bryobacteraceae bacterium]
MKRIVIVAPPDVTLQDVIGPHEVFSRAACRMENAYTVDVACIGQGKRVRTKFGLELVCTQLLRRVGQEVDTVLVAGSNNPVVGAAEPALLQWLRDIAPRVRRLGSVCTGAFYLAQAGLLAGRRATTHWRYCERLSKQFPDVRVETEPIFVRDGNIYTSAGITAGIDLALALVEEDHGHKLAIEIARELVVFIRRSADQAQFSATLSQQSADRSCIRELQRILVDRLDTHLTIEEMASLVNMNPRNFARVFARETGATPARYLERLRVEAARRRLREGRDGVDTIAGQVGFGSSKSMRRAFLRTLRITPAAYRDHYENTSIQKGE